MTPFTPYQPDQGALSPNSTDVAINVMPLSNGFGPFPSESTPTTALPGPCLGAWYVRATGGAYQFYATTQTAIYKLGGGGVWTSVGSGYTGPLPGQRWVAEKYGSRFYVLNEIDGLQFIDVDVGSTFAAAPGSPPKAKYIRVIGDFLFLAGLRVGATSFPQDWQHSAIDDPASWSITGAPGASDRQSIPSGDEITGVMASSNSNGRILQRRAKRGLIFTPGSATAFQQRDIDTMNGVFAPHSIVDIGGDDYVYIHEQGIFRGDSHTPIGLDKMSATILATVDYDNIEQIQGVLEARNRRVLWRAQNTIGNWFVFGYHIVRDQFFMTDVAANSLNDTVGVATLIDDIHGLVDSFPTVLVDSPLFSGGRVASGGFLAKDNKMYTFTGPPKAATIETSTAMLNEFAGSLITSASVLGDVPTWSMQIGHSPLPEGPLTWSGIQTRSSLTGDAPFMVDDNFHRFRVSIPAGVTWTHAHGVVPKIKQTRRLA